MNKTVPLAKVGMKWFWDFRVYYKYCSKAFDFNVLLIHFLTDAWSHAVERINYTANATGHKSLCYIDPVN